jgi:hypothetical protein
MPERLPSNLVKPEEEMSGKVLDPREPKPTEKSKAVSPAVEEMAARFLSGDYSKPVTEEKKPVEKKVEADPKAEKPKAAKPKPKAAPVQHPLTQEQIVAAAAEGAARAVAPKPEPKKEAPKPDAELSDANRLEAEVLDHLGKINPKYKETGAKYRTSLKLLADYQKKWEAANEGQEFDPEADEHEDFYAKNDVHWDDQDFLRAAVDLGVEQKLATKLEEHDKTTVKKLDDRLAEIERERLQETTMPEVNAQVNTAAKGFWDALGDQFEGLVKEENGAHVIDSEKLKAIEADPDLANLVFGAAQQLQAEVGELYKLMTTKKTRDGRAFQLAQFDKDNPVHAAVAAFCDEVDQAFASKPEEDQLDEKGRRFLPAEEYFKRLKTDRKATEEGFWTPTFDDLKAIRVARTAKATKDRIESEEKRLEAFAQRRGYRRGDGEPELEANGKPVTPSSGSTPKAASRNGAAGKGAETGVSAFIARGL